MKIISIGPAFPYRGGPATFNDRLSQQFSAEGHEVKVFTFRLQYPKLLFPGKSQYTDSPPPHGISITRKINSINPINWILTGFLIKREKPDILLIRFWLPFMGPCFGTIARIAKSNRHTTVICIFDNVIPHEKRPGDMILTRYFINSIDGAITMSETVRNDLNKFRQDLPVKLSPHPLFDNYGLPVDRAEALKKLNLDTDYSYLLFFGFIRAYKGLDLLIEAFSDSRLRNRKLKLIVAGEFYEDDTPYKDLLKKHNLENEIILFDHFIKDKDVPLFFCASDLVIQPYKTATQSGVTQIAFYFEKPMLVTDVGGLREIVQDGKCGYVVKPKPELITAAIIDFFDNNRMEQFTDGVKKEKEKFSWDKMTSAILEVYDRCLSPTPRRGGAGSPPGRRG
jgi:glycosyltransferase involved in cell wall biosynthesis